MYLITIIVNVITVFVIFFLIYKYNKQSDNLLQTWKTKSISNELYILDKKIHSTNEEISLSEKHLSLLKHSHYKLELQIKKLESLFNLKIIQMKKHHTQNIKLQQQKQAKEHKIHLINEIFKQIAKKLHKDKNIIDYFNE